MTCVFAFVESPDRAGVPEAERGFLDLQGRTLGHGEEEEGAAVCPECRPGIQDSS